jgi:site-specific recombinase XerD
MHAPSSDAPSWSDRVNQFIAYLADEEKSAHTQRNYRDDLLKFAEWYRQHNAGDEPELARVAKRDLIDWKEHIEKQGGRPDRQGHAHAAAVATVNRKLAAVRKFFQWAQELNLAPPLSPPKPKKRQGRRKPKSLEPDERKALLKAIEAKGDTRDILLIRTGLDGGLRVSEMASLKWARVKITERKGEMRIEGKGKKERIVPLTKALRHAFLEHGYERHKGKDKPVFDGQRGGLSIRGIQDIIERYGRTTRVGKRIGLDGFSVHSLRHTCADWLLNEQGMSVPDVAEILGHSDYKTTMEYLRPHHGRLADRMAAIEG